MYSLQVSETMHSDESAVSILTPSIRSYALLLACLATRMYSDESVVNFDESAVSILPLSIGSYSC